METEPDDPALVGQAIDFEAPSFRNYDKHLQRYLLRRLPRRQDAEDLAQEVYLRLLRIDSNKRLHKPLAYIYGVASHVVASHRSESLQANECFSEDEDALEVDLASSLDELADRLDMQQQLERALTQLPRMHARVLLAHKYCGFSYEEVAAELGISIHTVEKYLTQAKARIRTMARER